jgi:hypothetical protein
MTMNIKTITLAVVVAIAMLNPASAQQPLDYVLKDGTVHLGYLSGAGERYAPFKRHGALVFKNIISMNKVVEMGDSDLAEHIRCEAPYQSKAKFLGVASSDAIIIEVINGPATGCKGVVMLKEVFPPIVL